MLSLNNTEKLIGLQEVKEIHVVRDISVSLPIQ